MTMPIRHFMCAMTNLQHLLQTKHAKTRDCLAKTLRPKTLGTRGKDARRWSQDQENLIKESCLDCKIHLTAILGKCTDISVLHQPGSKDQTIARCRLENYLRELRLNSTTTGLELTGSNQSVFRLDHLATAFLIFNQILNIGLTSEMPLKNI